MHVLNWITAPEIEVSGPRMIGWAHLQRAVLVDGRRFPVPGSPSGPGVRCRSWGPGRLTGSNRCCHEPGAAADCGHRLAVARRRERGARWVARG
jgi:hypothetical protein